MERTNGSRAIKRIAPDEARQRRTQDDIEQLQKALYTIVEEAPPMTVRHVFYRAVSVDLVSKTENGYRVIKRELLKMRRAETLPNSWIADNTRWIRKPRTYRSLQEALEATARVYRRAMWDTSTVHIEVWAESDSVASVIVEETARWDVALMVFRGYSSEGYLYNLAEELRDHGRDTIIYYVGDHDPSGIDIPRAALKRIRELSPDVPLQFERLAITPEQISLWNLPTRPPK